MGKNTHVQHKNALFQFKLKRSTMLSFGEKNLEILFHKTGNDPLMTFDPLSVKTPYAPTKVKSPDQDMSSSRVICRRSSIL